MHYSKRNPKAGSMLIGRKKVLPKTTISIAVSNEVIRVREVSFSLVDLLKTFRAS